MNNERVPQVRVSADVYVALLDECRAQGVKVRQAVNQALTAWVIEARASRTLDKVRAQVLVVNVEPPPYAKPPFWQTSESKSSRDARDMRELVRLREEQRECLCESPAWKRLERRCTTLEVALGFVRARTVGGVGRPSRAGAVGRPRSTDK